MTSPVRAMSVLLFVACPINRCCTFGKFGSRTVREGARYLVSMIEYL